jgi:hypothetical protein
MKRSVPYEEDNVEMSINCEIGKCKPKATFINMVILMAMGGTITIPILIKDEWNETNCLENVKVGSYLIFLGTSITSIITMFIFWMYFNIYVYMYEIQKLRFIFRILHYISLLCFIGFHVLLSVITSEGCGSRQLMRKMLYVNEYYMAIIICLITSKIMKKIYIGEYNI